MNDLEYRIDAVEEYKRTHGIEMMVVNDPNGGYMGYPLGKSIYPIVYRTDKPIVDADTAMKEFVMGRFERVK